METKPAKLLKNGIAYSSEIKLTSELIFKNTHAYLLK